MSGNFSMRFWFTAKRPRRVGKCAIALMVLLWLGTLGLKASPGLHRIFHPDAKSPSHNCVVTQLQHHLVLVGAAPAVAPLSAPDGLAAIRSREFQFLPVQDTRLSFSRGPPWLVSSFPVAG